jgi:hypothetical protein
MTADSLVVNSALMVLVQSHYKESNDERALVADQEDQQYEVGWLLLPVVVHSLLSVVVQFLRLLLSIIPN